MRKFRSDSILGKLPEEKQVVLYDVLAGKPLVACVDEAGNEIESGIAYLARVEGIHVGKSALSDWLRARRMLLTGDRLRKGREMARHLAKDAKGQEAYDPVVFAALKEHLLNQIATDNLSVDEAQKLGQIILADRRLALDTERLKSGERAAEKRIALQTGQLRVAERRVAVLERKFADAAKTLGDETLTDAQRVAKMRGIFSLNG